MKRREILEAIGLGMSALALTSCRESGDPRTQVQALPKTAGTTKTDADNSEGKKSDDAKAANAQVDATKDQAADSTNNTAANEAKTAVDPTTSATEVIDVDKLVALTVYSKAAPGKWAGKESSHAPELSIAENKLTISTPHVMCRDHYIMSYQVRNKKGTILSEHLFAQPPSSTSLTASSNTLRPTVIDLTPFKLTKGEELRVYSLCNQHGYWVANIFIS